MADTKIDVEMAIGIGLFVISFYETAPQDAFLRIQRERLGTKFECSIVAGDPRRVWTEGCFLEDSLLQSAQFDVAAHEGAGMGVRISGALQRNAVDRDP